MAECDICGREFDTERGVQIHRRQAHPDADGPDEEPEQDERRTTEKSASFGNLTLNLKVTHAVLAAFLIGIFAGGFFVSTLFGAAGVTGMLADGPSNPGGGSGDPAPSDTGNDAPTQGQVDPSKISLEGEPSLGDEDAPVTIVEFSDYQCPFCRRFALNTFDRIKEEYISSGRVRFVYKDFPLEQLGHNRAVKMAEAAQCAGDQGKYWEMHDKLFNEQQDLSSRGTAKFAADRIPTWAEEIGLDMDTFNQCLDSGTYTDEVKQDLQEGQALGVSGTPTFFINGKKIVGAQPYSAFRLVIESELS